MKTSEVTAGVRPYDLGHILLPTIHCWGIPSQDTVADIISDDSMHSNITIMHVIFELTCMSELTT